MAARRETKRPGGRRGRKINEEAARRLEAGPRTYRIFSRLDKAVFGAIFEGLGFALEPDVLVPVTLLHMDGGIKTKPIEQSVAQFALIKSKLRGHDVFVDKDLMYNHANAAMREFMPRSATTAAAAAALALPIIIKPGAGARGEGIVVATTRPEAAAAWRRIRRPIASEYLADPFLFEGRKSHFRVYMLITVFAIDGAPMRRAWLCREGLVVSAKLPYVKADFGNADIHDSHMKSTTALHFISGLREYPAFFAAIAAAAARTIVYAPHFGVYPDQRHGYNIYGLDMLYDTVRRRMYLLEVNKHTSFGFRHGGKTEMSKIFFGGIAAVVAAFYTGRYAALRDIHGFVRAW